MVRIVDGEIKKGDKIYLMASKGSYEVLKVGVFSPGAVAQPSLKAG